MLIYEAEIRQKFIKSVMFRQSHFSENQKSVRKSPSARGDNVLEKSFKHSNGEGNSKVVHDGWIIGDRPCSSDIVLELIDDEESRRVDFRRVRRPRLYWNTLIRYPRPDCMPGGSSVAVLVVGWVSMIEPKHIVINRNQFTIHKPGEGNGRIAMVRFEINV